MEDTIAQGEQLFGAGKIEDALRVFIGAVKLHPDSAVIWNNLGVGFTAIGRHEDALDALDRAIQLRKDYREARLNRASVLGRLGRKADEVAALQEAAVLWPGDAELTSLLAQARQLP
jgi:Flp pilus assembly protein TadD